MPAHPPGTLSVLTRPHMLLLHLAGVLAVTVSSWLGLWQLDAWQSHRENRAADLADAEPQPLQDVLGPDDAFPRDGAGRPVTFTGSWLPETTVYVEGRQSQGRIGYWLLTDAAVCAEGTGCPQAPAMPVVVGWTPNKRADAPQGSVEVTGWLQPDESEPDPDPTDDVTPGIRTTDLLQRSDRDLYGAYVILEQPEEARAGLRAVTPDSLPEPPTFTALRNLLYGIEWWFFGGFAIFLWVRWCRDELIREQDPAEAQPVQEGARIPSNP